MEKVSMFCHVTPKQVMGVHNVSSTYHVPLLLEDQGMLDYLRKRLALDDIIVSLSFSLFFLTPPVNMVKYILVCGGVIS